MADGHLPKEETLDPADWDEMKALGHRMLDDMFDYLKTIRTRPAWTAIPDSIKSKLDVILPEEAQGVEDVYRDFRELVFPYMSHAVHPRFWGWVVGSGSVFGMLSEMLAAGLNAPDSGFNLASSYVEMQVLSWCKTMLGYPQAASGILVSGGSMANLIGLTVARNSKAGFDIMKQGLQSDKKVLTVYGSREMHSSIDKAVESLGLGDQALRKIPVRSDYGIDMDILRKTIADDREKGFHPIAVVGNAGTVNTGAFDDLNAMADLCAAEGLWFHIDGAFGAWVALSSSHRHLVKGMDRADSVAFDLHKWMYMQYEVGCCLVRHREEHHKAFAVGGSYLTPTTRGFAAGPVRWNEHGIQLSRGFRSLKVWMALKENGAAKYRRLIQQNIVQAQYLASLIQSNSALELLAPVPSNVVCFRFVVQGKNEPDLNALNQEIVLQLQEKGIAVPSSTILNGKFAIRAAITNHRSRSEDFELFVHEAVRLGNEISKTG